MKSIQSNSIGYTTGGAVVILGIFIIALPSIIISGVSDIEISPTSTSVLTVGAILGLPVVGAGIALSQERYQLWFYFTLFTGIIYVAAPIVLFQSLFFLYYIPAAIVFVIVLATLIGQY